MIHANEKFVRLVRQYGGAGSDAVLEPGTKFFHVENIDGFIGYRHVHKCAISFGDPVCHERDMAALSEAFHKFTRENGLKPLYIGATERFSKVAMNKLVNVSLHFGDEYIFDPEINPRDKSGPQACLVRRKIKRAKKEGISAHEYHSDDPDIEQAIVDAGQQWKDNRRGRQVHISDFYLFEHRHGKRWFYAKKEDRIVGGITLNKIESHGGYLLNHLFVLPEASKGTSELLFTTALDAIKEEGYRHATVGYVAGSELYSVAGFGRLTTFLLKKAYAYAERILSLNRLSKFWSKFMPSTKPTYILFDKKQLRVTDIIHLAKTLNADKK